jgi:hypothetical protein
MAGDQVPVIPFNDVVGSENVPLKQIALTCVNVGWIGSLKLTTEAGEVPVQPYEFVTVTV